MASWRDFDGELDRVVFYDRALPESEFAYDPYAEQDLTPSERDYYERHKYDPEREER